MGVLGMLQYIVVYATYFIVSSLFILITYRVSLHPLRKYPGPLIAKFTDVYGGYYAMRRCLHLVIFQNHEKYGPVYRQGPNRLMFNSATALHEILQNPRVEKSLVYALTRVTPKASIFDTMDPIEHRRKRKIVSLPLTEKSMRTFEPVIVEYVDKFIERISESESEPLNMSERCRDLMGDIVGQLSFGYPLNMQGEETNRWLLPGLNLVSWRINAYMQLPSLQKLEPFFKGAFKKGRAKYLAIVTKMIKARISLDKDARHDLYSFAIDHLGRGSDSLGDSELWAEAFFFIVAGGTTPTTTISAMFWYLSRYPECYEKLAHEIRFVFQSPEEIRSGEKLQRCKYLRASINETLRIATPNTGVLWREHSVTNEKGKKDSSPLIIDGHVIPPGTMMGINLYSVHHSEANFPEPFVFRPERWLEGDSNEESAQNAFAPFGLGNRSCSGRAVAYLELSLAIAQTLWHFDFERAPEELGKIGGGEKGEWSGRGRVEEYQQYDTFSSVHDGPYLTFRRRLQDEVPQTPVTPVSAEAVASIHKLIEQDLYMLDEMNRPRLQRHLQKLTHAVQLSFAERSLLLDNNQFLAQINNEAKVRRSTKFEILGTARVMSYEDLENARAMRAAKETAKQAKKAAKEAKRAEYSSKLKEAPLGKKRRSWKTKNYGPEPKMSPVRQPMEQEMTILGDVVWTCEGYEQDELVRPPLRAPIAPM